MDFGDVFLEGRIVTRALEHSTHFGSKEPVVKLYFAKCDVCGVICATHRPVLVAMVLPVALCGTITVACKGRAFASLQMCSPSNIYHLPHGWLASRMCKQSSRGVQTPIARGLYLYIIPTVRKVA